MKLFGSEKQEKRVLIFIDILGFANFIKNMNPEDEEKLQAIYKNFESSSNKGSLKNGYIFKPSFTFFSDTIVVSWPIENSIRHFWQAFVDTSIIRAENLQRYFFQELRLLSRGAIHVGVLYHNHPTIYGMGLIEAYKKEKEEISKPAVILTPEFVEYFKDEIITFCRNGPADMKLFFDESKREYSIDFLGFLRNATAKTKALEYKTLIESNMRHECKSVREKWEWFADRFNYVLRWHSVDEIKLT